MIRKTRLYTKQVVHTGTWISRAMLPQTGGIVLMIGRGIKNETGLDTVGKRLT